MAENAVGVSATQSLGEEGSDWAWALGRGKHSNALQTQVLVGKEERAGSETRVPGAQR